MHKRYKLLRLRAFEDVILARCLEGLQHGAGVFIAILLQICHATLAKVALRHVRHAQKRQVVPDRDKAQVAQRVLDLASAEKGHAAEQRIRDIRLQKRLFDRTGCVVRAIQHRDIAIGNPLAMQCRHAFGYPGRLGLRRCGMMPDRGTERTSCGDKVLRNAHMVFRDKRIRHRKHLRHRTVVLEHHDSARAREVLIEIEQQLHIRAAPRIDGLIGIADHEQVPVIALQHLHELVLQRIDILKLVDHDVFQALLPFEADIRELLEHVEREHDQVVVIEPEALPFLVKIPIENDVPHIIGLQIPFTQLRDRPFEHVQIVVRMLFELLYLDHVARSRKRHIAQRKASFFINGLQHGIDVGVVEHQEAFRVPHGMGIFLENRNAKAMERVDIAGIMIAGKATDAPSHLVGGLVRESDAQDVARQDAEIVDQVCEPLRQRSRFPRAGACDDAHVTFRCRNGLSLSSIELRLFVELAQCAICRHRIHNKEYIK